jgi:hypothetical protein
MTNDEFGGVVEHPRANIRPLKWSTVLLATMHIRARPNCISHAQCRP